MPPFLSFILLTGEPFDLHATDDKVVERELPRPRVVFGQQVLDESWREAIAHLLEGCKDDGNVSRPPLIVCDCTHKRKEENVVCSMQEMQKSLTSSPRSRRTAAAREKARL